MESKDTTKTENELCIIAGQDYRREHLEAKDCGHEDCGKCQLTKQGEISFKAGKQDGRKEVVEWIKGHTLLCGHLEDNDWYEIDNIDLAIQLKAWGLED